MESFRLNTLDYLEGGRKIVYNYTISDGLKQYFDRNNDFYVAYQVDVSDVSPSINIIPLLANIMPISWIVGFDVYVDEMDEQFLSSLEKLKEQFKSFHPNKQIKGELYFNKKVTNKIEEDKVAQLFSGGLDSWDTFTRNYDKDPYLFSIHGADVPIEDSETWKKFQRFNAEERIVNQNNLYYIESNLRDFYTYKLDLLADLGWWGTVQHGMALIGVLAPLSLKLGFKHINIAASATPDVEYTWGSSPKIDENMLWATTHVYHEGYHLDRTQKIGNVVNFTKKHDISLKLRVCYSDLRNAYNCNVCAKCQRTILSLILLNENPVPYGFEIADNFYQMLMGNFNDKTTMTAGIKYQWARLQEMARKAISFYVHKDEAAEAKYIERFSNIDLDEVVNKNQNKVYKKKELKFKLRNKFPGLYNIYQKIKN